MADLENLVKEQNENVIALQQGISNYKKTPTDRKTLEYIERKQKNLDALWDNFQKVDKRLRNDLPEKHAYFNQDLYAILGEKYNAVKSAMNDELQKIKLSNSANTSKNPTLVEDQVKQKKVIETVQRLIQEVLSKQNQTTQFYSTKLKTIEQHWRHAYTLHERLFTSSAAYDFDKFCRIEDTINEGIIQIQELSCKDPPQPNRVAYEHVSVNDCKLPKVELPKFDGTYLNWRNFYDLFSELVDKKPLPNCQKLLYLKSSLTGEAKGLIQHFATTSANYVAAWKTLTDRYENKRILVNTVLKQLLAQSPINDTITSLKQVHDTTQESLKSLQNLGIITDNWDPILLHILLQRLNKTSYMLWEQSLLNPQEMPNLDEFLTFIKHRFQSLEALSSKTISNTPQGQLACRALGVAISVNNPCIICQDAHSSYSCAKFLALTPKERLAATQKAKRCVNCLKTGHNAKNCTTSTCKKCNKKHNTLLHLEGTTQSTFKTSKDSVNQSATVTTVAAGITKPSTVLLSTISVHVTNANGDKIQCRAILDSGSQGNFITKYLANRLGLKPKSCLTNIEGIGQTHSQTSERLNIEVTSTSTGFSKRIETLILTKIISHQPSVKIDTTRWNIPKNIKLSDINFNSPDRVDMLLGAGLFYSILCVGQISLGKGMPTLQNTLFGWVVGGECANNANSTDSLHCGIGVTNLNDNLEKFWQLEEFEVGKRKFTASETRCETHFIQNVKRDQTGRFIVKLPFEQDANQLGESKDIALQRFFAIERKLTKNPTLRNEYVKFMREYESLHHMKEISPIEAANGPHYYLPHHAVFKDSTTTKVRVVFDASAKTSSNLSLNDILATGPTIQSDVFTSLLRFRLPRFAFTADIEKMYRQIWVSEEDQKFQLIWWREDPRLPLRCMQLSTVTYGTTCAPYLATRVLQQLADTAPAKYPLAIRALKNNFYVDDVLVGSDKISEALMMQQQLKELLKSAGLNLRKWCANDSRLLETIADKDREVSLDFTQENVKTMGITWYPKQDEFTIKVTQESSTKVSKRIALADISRLYDPLGLVAPVVVTAKIFLQKLWKLQLDWDAALPQELHTKWVDFRNNLELLKQISIPRHIFNHNTPNHVQVHIFADASEKAYGAAAYVRAVDTLNVITVRLLCSKSRVAPVKQITLPRLELCAAKLATDLALRLQEDKILHNCQTFYWSDSTAVLGWINATSANYHTFVANRISAIQQISTPQQWHYVKSELNPADLISRGCLPNQLLNNTIWFYGPLFLHGQMNSWPLQPPRAKCTLELRQTTISSNIVSQNTSIFVTVKHNNSLRRLQRIMAYVIRFFCKSKKGREEKMAQRSITSPSAIEMDNALLRLVKMSQQQDFADDIKHLKQEKGVNNNSSISSLSPFIDSDGLLRVGGRLQASELEFDAKHQLILSYHHPLTKMLFNAMHKENLHVGAQALLCIIRQRFWPLKGKNIARATIQGCVACTKAKPKLYQQLMGSLPKDRVQPARPFVNSGVDFFGPVMVHLKLRGRQPLKAYVAVFCCFATKAVHLELVSDLTTNAFLGALRRFMSRRGHCSKLYCDNATNFVGSKNQLYELNNILFEENAKEKVSAECSKKGIQFIFIPPRAPHFGGLWEAAVKSAKTLLHSTITTAKLTHEEMETLIIEAEAIMNSRPLTPMSSDPNDMTALTPGHLLIGEPLTATIDPRSKENKLSMLDRWQYVTRLKMEFWKRWSNEYLHSLQHRYKWKTEAHNIEPNTMVIIKEDNQPSCKWSLGRIKNVIRGDDGLVRVADIQTAKNIIRRPITKLAPLPTQNSTQDQSVQGDIPTGGTSDNDEHTHNPKRARVASSLLLTVIITLLILPLCMATTIDIQTFQSNPGLYFEQLGTANIMTSEWNIVTYVDMTVYWKWNNQITKYPKALQKLCAMSHRNSCTTVVSLVHQLTNELKVNNELLKHDKTSRPKRGAFNIIGNIANSLFGVLDESYASETADTIEKIRENEKHLAEQAQLQKSFLDNTLTIMKQNQEQIEKEFQTVEKSILSINDNISQLDNEVRKVKIATEFNDLALQTILLLTYLQRIQESLLDILTDSHHSKINPELLSPTQLEEQLNYIKTNLPASLKLPEVSDILKVYSIMNIEARIIDKFTIFNIRLPLVSAENFEILKITRVPWASNHIFYQIKSNFTFLIVNLHRDQYFPLAETELKSCTHMDKEKYLCYQSHPLYLRGSTTAGCELNLLNQNTVNSLCALETIGKGPHWIQLHNRNWWIYSVDQEMTANTVCENTLTKITLRNSGLLKLHENCVIKQPLITIRGYRAYKTSEVKAYIPDIDVDELITTDNPPPARETTSYISNYSPKTHELSKLQEQNSRVHISLPNQIRTHDIHHYSLGYTSFCLIIITLAYIIWKQRSRKETCKTTVALIPNQDNNPNKEDGDSYIITINGCTSCPMLANAGEDVKTEP